MPSRQDQDRALQVVEKRDVKKRDDESRSRPRGFGCHPLAALFQGVGGCLAPGMMPVLLAMGVLVACAAMLLTFQISDFLHNPIDSVLELLGFERDSKPEEVDSRTIVLGIQKMAVLQTATGDIQVIKTVVDSEPSPDAELKVSFIGHVTAGIDLALVTEENIVSQPDGSLVITLPPAQLTGCYLGKPDVLTRSCTGIPFVQDCGKIIENLQNEAYNRGIDELRETALEMDLLSLAYQEAESRIFALLDNLGYENVSFQLSTEPLTPNATCYPN